ncbi:outer membrane protein [Labrys portucalensis]|uniref:Outer membrane protein n=1 Tax=Labrys neptuniae TaxID=376174 RepID=A0ABV6ZNE1_9HYPH
MQILRNALLAGVVILAPAAAFAADLAPPPVEPVAPEIVPSFTWTGFYAGLSAGYGRGNLDTDLKAVPTARGQELENALGFGLNGGVARVKDTANGFVGGGQIGYNYQLDPHWVIGAEADLQYAGLDSKKTFIGDQNIPVTVKTELDWFGTARLRAGYAFDNVLVYGTGGLAYGHVKSKVTTGGTNLSGSETKFGWALGAGAEYALTQNWTIRAEYLYVDLGKAETIKANSDIAQVTAKADVSVHTVRAGVNYKF